jgi:hypothetical protein
MLMDVCSKNFSSVMNGRAFKLLEAQGTKFQFGGTPELGCRDGLFILKTMLTLRKNHNLPTYVGFVDLVKAYNTANHALLFDILERYGAPPRFVNAVERIYQDLVVVLKIEKEIVKIPQSVGVRQGDNMAPVLFLFLMSAFAETLEIEWKAAGNFWKLQRTSNFSTMPSHFYDSTYDDAHQQIKKKYFSLFLSASCVSFCLSGTFQRNKYFRCLLFTSLIQNKSNELSLSYLQGQHSTT